MDPETDWPPPAMDGQEDFGPDDMNENPSDCGMMDYSKREPNPVVHEWKDITKDFFESVKELSLGELMYDSMFGLFEAMSAIEMMDPKMDSGMALNKDKAMPLTFDTAVATGQLKLDGLTNSELIGIMDSLFACLVSWLEGHSLPQTVFTCLYLHKPQLIRDPALNAFCCAISKLTQIIREFAYNCLVFEEEDFQPNSCGYALLPKITDTKVCAMLKDARFELLKNPIGDQEEINAVACRLQFVRFFLYSLVCLWPKKHVSPTESEMSEILRHLTNAQDLIPEITRTIHLGTQPAPDSDAPNPMGFSPMVNQRLLLPSFPRYTKIKDRLSSITFLDELVGRLKLACKVVHCTTYHSALNFFIDFSKKGGSCMFSRSVLQNLYFPTFEKVFGVTPMSDILRESAKNFIAPAVLMPKSPMFNNPQAKMCVDSFFHNSSHTHVFTNFISICCFNRARLRDRLARLLDDFANIQDEVTRVDSMLLSLSIMHNAPRKHMACFGTWVFYHCLQAMTLYLLLGLELELYSMHELLYIFWYMAEYLFNWTITALSRAEASIKEQEHLTDQVAKNSNSKQTKKIKSKKKKPLLYYREIIENEALKQMASGYFKALVALTKEGRIPQPLSLFDNEKIRFEHRFAPFAGLSTPPPVGYADFKVQKDKHAELPTSTLYIEAKNNFHQARVILEQVQNQDQEMTDLLLVCKMNYVVMGLLAKGHKKDSITPPTFDFSHHRYFPVIKPQ